MASSADLARLRGEVGELVERSQGARAFGADEARTWTERGPVAFGTDRLGSSYWSRQVDLLNAARAHPRVAVRSANSMGKNFCTADFMAWWIFAKGGAVLYMAPTDRQLDIGMKELRRALHGAALPYELFHRSLRVRGETRLFAFTSNSADSLRGFHDPLGLLVVIDEGQGKSVEAVAFDAAFSCATGEGDKILVLGNPAHTGGKFHAISKADNWCALKIAAAEHPNISGLGAPIAGGPAADWPEQIAAEYGRESAFYLAFVEGEFPAEGAIDGLVKLQWLEDAYGRHAAGVALQPAPLPVLALDPARSLDRDESVCALAQGASVLALDAWHSRDLVATAGQFLAIGDRARLAWDLVRRHRTLAPEATLPDRPDALARWLADMGVPPFPLVIDAPGVGSGVVDDCLRRGRTVIEYWGWNPPRDPQRFANTRAEAYWHFRTLVQDGTAALPRDGMLHEEAVAIQWSQDARGRIAILPKDELRHQLGGRSPDRLDSCVMALYASAGGVRPPLVSFETFSYG